MARANSYDEWKAHAKAWDAATGAEEWRRIDRTRLYDYRQISLRLNRLRNLRKQGDDTGLLFTLNEGIHGNMGGMGRAALYHRAKVGTKKLIEDYVAEIASAIDHLRTVDSPDIPVAVKKDFFERANQCYGCTSLMLSGGGALGFFHFGVTRVLRQQGIMPKVISGASAGSIAAAIMGTHTDQEFETLFDNRHLLVETRREARWMRRLLLGEQAQLETDDLVKLLERLIPDLTFQEAYEKTGYKINISVSPAEMHQSSRMLNAIASPNVLIRSAVMASCAVPGVFPPVSLQAKDMDGRKVPYLATRKWVDGSITGDLPAKRLARLYGVNHYVVSMINPIAAPVLSRRPDGKGVYNYAAKITKSVVRSGLEQYRDFARKRLPEYTRLNLMVNGVYGLVNQDYSGDINIMPAFRFVDPRKLLANLNEKDLLWLIESGEKATWPHVERMRISMQINQVLEKGLDALSN